MKKSTLFQKIINIILNRLYYCISDGNLVMEGEQRQFSSVQCFKKAYLEIGKGVIIGKNSNVAAMGHVVIGKNTLIAPNCYIHDTTHVLHDGKIIDPLEYETGKTEIGKNCWICEGCVIINSTVADNTVLPAKTILINNQVYQLIKREKDEYQKPNRRRL